MKGHRRGTLLRTPAVSLRNVSVSRGGRVILRHVAWTVLAGQSWAVLSHAFGCPVQVVHRHRRWSLHVHPKAWSSLLTPRKSHNR